MQRAIEYLYIVDDCGVYGALHDYICGVHVNADRFKFTIRGELRWRDHLLCAQQTKYHQTAVSTVDDKEPVGFFR